MRDMRQAFGSTVSDLVDLDDRVAVVLAEISTSYFERAIAAHPDRVINVGIMEQTMVGVAAGFAMEGFRPIAHSLSPFMAERPYEQLKLDFGYQGLGGTFVGVGGSYDYASSGGTHHTPADAGVMLGIPGMEVLIPGHGDEMDALLRSTYANGRPTYIRASVATNVEPHRMEPGRIEVIRRGAAATVLAFGPMLDRTVAACEGLDVTIAYATSLRPFDGGALAAIAGEVPVLITVEPFYEGTAAPVMTAALGDRPMRYVSIGVPRAFIHAYGEPEDIDADLGLDEAGLAHRLGAIVPMR
ncbi:MAG TPA: transketolase [Actinomycetota bacterium]|jgi:transketolase|nr:transketolase [Actinomycetota bacterium]